MEKLLGHDCSTIIAATDSGARVILDVFVEAGVDAYGESSLPDRQLVLGPGQRVRIGKGTANLAVQAVASRNRRSYCTNGQVMVMDEFSIPGVLCQDELFRNIVHSNSAVDRDLIGRILKIAAVLFIVTPSRGAYVR